MHADEAYRMRQADTVFETTVRELGATSHPYFSDLSRNRLRWLPELGLGYYPVSAGIKPYDQAYFDRYSAQADTDLGRALMKARVEFVSQFWTGDLLDIGIGSGAFIDAWDAAHPGLAWGYDVNPAAVQWLGHRYCDPYRDGAVYDAISLWDVFEHIPDPRSLLSHVPEYVFMSLPIFRNMEHVLQSKHYRKDEHYWYFTSLGLVDLMSSLDFKIIDHSTIETRLGREDIHSFAFKRR
jgi:hypothetical protein